uniref:Uncharacterized protein n=1 Tax=Arundo donax TaxID=35708 RepID=A0A0A9BMT2_ARUDO
MLEIFESGVDHLYC